MMRLDRIKKQYNENRELDVMTAEKGKYVGRMGPYEKLTIVRKTNFYYK